MKLKTIDPHCASGGDQNLSKSNSVHGCINMVHATKVVTHVKDYGSSQLDLGKKPTPPESPLRIKKPTDKPEVAPRIPKGFLKRSGHNPNARATQNYSIVEDLGQTPCVMSTLEVLQTCLLQRRALLCTLGVDDDNSSSIIKFETMGIHPRFSFDSCIMS